MEKFSTKVKVLFTKQLTEDLPIPTYQTGQAAGADIHCASSTPIVIRPGCSESIPTGLHLQIPGHLRAEIKARSGLAYHSKVFPIGCLIDPDYRGQIMVVLYNYGRKRFTVQPRDRIAQIVFTNNVRANFQLVKELSITPRNEGSFGSTGK